MLICPVGEYSRRLAAFLTQAGHDAASLAGGIVAWRDAWPAAGIQPRPRERQLITRSVSRTARDSVGYGAMTTIGVPHEHV